MEIVFGRAKSRFINQRIGSVERGQRFSASVNLMNELASMGLVDLEVGAPKKPSPTVEVQPLSVSPVVEALPITTVELPKKRVYKKKQK